MADRSRSGVCFGYDKFGVGAEGDNVGGRAVGFLNCSFLGIHVVDARW